MTERLIDERWTFTRDEGRGAVSIRIVNEPKNQQYIEFLRTGDRTASIRFYLEETGDLAAVTKRVDELIWGHERQRKVGA